MAMSSQEINAMVVQAASYSAYAAVIGTMMATMGKTITGEAPEAGLSDLRRSFGSKIVDQAIKNVGKDDVVRLAEEIDRLFVDNLRQKYGNYATEAALGAVPPGETKKVEEVARVLSGQHITYATEAVSPELVAKVTEKAKKRAATKYPAKPQMDTKTGVIYKSMHAAYVGVAVEYGLDPANHFGIYGVKKQDPTRFKTVSTDKYIKYRDAQMP